MAILLKQSTAKAISYGPFVDKTDGVTPETGLVSAIDHATTGILLSKNGGALTIRSQAVTASTYDAYGNYIVTLSTTDTGTLGTLRMQFIETATCLPVWMDFMVLPATVYDALVTNAVNATGGLTGATGAITGLAGVIATTTGAVGSVTGAVGSVTGAVGSVSGLTASNLDATISSRAAASDLAVVAGYLDTEIAAIKTVTDQFTAAQAESAAVPAANASPLAKIAFLATLARNRITQTATTQTLYADNGSTPVAAATVSDDGTTGVRSEFV